jgi:N-acetylglutamate synthase-like GNAT family acetyltransferase
MIRAAVPNDRPELETFLARWNALFIARRGMLESSLDHPGLIAESSGKFTAALTYVVRGRECEVLTLHVDNQGNGIGSALIAALKEIARNLRCKRLWLITTNDNIDALRFYQRRGFRLAVLRCGAVSDSRAHLKPEIPLVGRYMIPLRDELELECEVTAASDAE